MSASAKRSILEMLIVVLVYSLAYGVGIYLSGKTLFQTDQNQVDFLLYVYLPVGIALAAIFGGGCWWLICGIGRRYSWVRIILTGVLTWALFGYFFAAHTCRSLNPTFVTYFMIMQLFGSIAYMLPAALISPFICKLLVPFLPDPIESTAPGA